MYAGANRHQLHRPYGRKNFGYVYADRRGIAGAWDIPVPSGLCRRRGNRTHLRFWVFACKRRDQGRAKGLVRCVHGRIDGSERRRFGGGYLFLFNGGVLQIAQQEKLTKIPPCENLFSQGGIAFINPLYFRKYPIAGRCRE